MGLRLARTAALPLLTLVVSALVAPLAARADEYVNRVNATFSKIPQDKRSDLVILPALAKMEAPPAEIDTVDKAVLLLPTSAGWDAAVAWAQGEPQKAVLAALSQITGDEDFHVAMVFAQGYGVEAVADKPDLISANLYTELGDPPTLANAQYGYLERMRQAKILANIEASRLMKDGNFVGAIDVMFDVLYFARQLADRPMLPEKKIGMENIRQALERIRDIVYLDLRGETHKLDYKVLRGYVERLDATKGYLGIDRITLPMGTLDAAEQVLTRVLIEKKGVNEATFVPVLSRVAAGDRPLRLFSEAAYWETVRPLHEGWYASMDMLVGKDYNARNGGLRYDWQKRWELSRHDSYVKLASDYKRYVATGPRFAALRAVLSDIESLYPLKTALQTEIVGTRMSLAVYGYWREHNSSFPPALSSIRPSFVPAVDNDPYASTKRPIGYFVPIRDNIPKQDPRKDPIPWSIRGFPAKPYKSFSIPLREDTFVLFSVGPDDAGVNAKDATQDDASTEGDYLLWPPMLSLIRQHLIDTGELK
jgi:hypothetical protein